MFMIYLQKRVIKIIKIYSDTQCQDKESQI